MLPRMPLGPSVQRETARGTNASPEHDKNEAPRAGADLSTAAVPVGNAYDKEGSTNPIERRLVRGFTNALLDFLPSGPCDALEVGCGEGGQLKKVAAAVPGLRLVGVDLPSPALAARWEGLDADMVCSSGAALPFRDGTFDLVLALEMLEHVPDPDLVLAEIARVARGRVVLSVPWEPAWRLGNIARGRYLRQLGNTPGHLQHFTRKGFLRVVDRHLDVIDVRRPFPWTFVHAEVRGVRGAA
jgi:SAM-dependent methyltransferase